MSLLSLHVVGSVSHVGTEWDLEDKNPVGLLSLGPGVKYFDTLLCPGGGLYVMAHKCISVLRTRLWQVCLEPG